MGSFPKSLPAASAAPQGAAKRSNATIVVVLVHGGPLDVSWMQESERVGAILTAWYPGQVRGLPRRDPCS